MDRPFDKLAIERRRSATKSLVGFVVGDVHYAIVIQGVREIINPHDLTTLPHTPKEVAGVAAHRGEIVPVVDLRVRFGLPAQAPSRATKWILVHAGERDVALVVDSVTEVFGSPTDPKPPPDVGGPAARRGISGVVSHRGRMIFVLDTSRFTEIVDDLVERGALDDGDSDAEGEDA